MLEVFNDDIVLIFCRGQIGDIDLKTVLVVFARLFFRQKREPCCLHLLQKPGSKIYKMTGETLYFLWRQVFDLQFKEVVFGLPMMSVHEISPPRLSWRTLISTDEFSARLYYCKLRTDITSILINPAHRASHKLSVQTERLACEPFGRGRGLVVGAAHHQAPSSPRERPQRNGQRRNSANPSVVCFV